MVRVAIADDNKEISHHIEEVVRKEAEKLKADLMVETKTYTSCQVLRYDLEREQNYDVYLLDIEMPKFSGMQLAEFIRDTRKNACIIFITSHSEYALQGFALNIRADYYILKENIDFLLPRIMARVLRDYIVKPQRYYFIQTSIRFEKILYEDIIYIYKDKKNSVFVAKDGTHKERASLEQVLERLADEKFILIERGKIVNIEHIQKIQVNEVFMDNGERLEISRKNVTLVKGKVSAYWKDRM